MLLFFGFLILAGPPEVAAQRPVSVASRPPGFESWQLEAPLGLATPSRLPAARFEIRRRGRHALIGAAIGTVAGLGVCTLISNIVADDGAGVSTCTTKGYLLFGGVGFALGFAVGLSV
jgi:hypothetical protein